jgi:hypothetical protein
MADPNDSRPTKSGITAVIAVHGVGNQKPFETARAIGDLLQDLAAQPRPATHSPACAEPGPESPRYYPFREQRLRINVNPVVMREAETAAVAATPRRRATRGPFNSWVEACLKSGKVETYSGESKPDLHTEFMKGQLMCYGGDDPKDTYETVRLEGDRAPLNGAPQQSVHIYELYWADLSRLKAGVFSIFTELYQLLFHLSSLGSHTVNAAVLHHMESRRWRGLRNLQSWSSVALTVPVPILNIFMLAIAGVVVGIGLLGRAQTNFQDFGVHFVAIVCGVAVTVFTGIPVWKSMSRRAPRFIVWILPLLLGIATAWLLWKARYGVSTHLVGVEALIVAIVAAGLSWAILAQYNERRPGLGAWTLGLALVIAATTAISWQLTSPAPGSFFEQINPGLLRLFETSYGALCVAWAVLFGLVILTWIAGLLAPGVKPLGRDTDSRSRWTGCLLLSLPTLIFSAITIVGWLLLVNFAQKLLPTDSYHPFLPFVQATCAAELANSLLRWPELILPLVLFAIGMASLPALWSMSPVVWAEVFPPAPATALDPKVSNRLGGWLTLAYRGGLLLSGILLFVVSTFVLPGIVLADMVGSTHLPGHIFIARLGVLSGAIFTWLFLARGSLKKLALGFRPALDIFLDVDNWLREHPLNRNPKARICGRYASLLRYVSNWKSDAYPDGYEKIVIVAHSQGTVISADLLRFLNRPSGFGRKTFRELDPQLDRLAHLPISLFTMGCPLRQLYGLRFPYLYDWAVHQANLPMGTWQPDDLIAKPPRGPEPQELGVALWVNAFRSGDYVGRYLWRSDVCGYQWQPGGEQASIGTPVQFVSSDGKIRLEFCIGAGAHTHYWDSTAPMISEEIDRLIASPAAQGQALAGA